MSGKELMALRLRYNISQKELAKGIGVRRETISVWEKKEKISTKNEVLIKSFMNNYLSNNSDSSIKIKGDNNSNIGNNIVNRLDEEYEEDRIKKKFGFDDLTIDYIDPLNTDGNEERITSLKLDKKELYYRYRALRSDYLKLIDKNNKLKEELNQAQKKLIELLSK